MPFNSSYRDFDKSRYLDAREQVRNLANIIVRDPLSTHIIKMSVNGHARYLVVDRAMMPGDGDIAVICTPRGLRAVTVKQVVPEEDIWGKVTWYIQEG
jgi:hypothetical protein